MVHYTTTAGGALRARIGGGFKLVYDSSTAAVDTGFGTPLFSASFENGDTVPTWADQELSFGESFVKGEVPAGSRVRAVVNGAVIPCQASNRRVWPDGSLRVADFKVQVPSVPVGAMLEVVWERVDGSWTAHDTPLHTSTAAITSKVALEYAFTSWKGRTAANALTEERGPKVFRSTDMLGAGNSPWIDNVVAGPVCCEWRASDMALLPGGGKDSNFGAILYAQAWGGTAGNPKRIRFVYRTMQGWSTDTPADEQGIRVDANLNVNGTTVRGAAIGTSGWSSINTWKGGFLMSAGTEGEMDWYDVATASWVTPPKLVYRRNIEHGVASRFIPPIDTSNPSMPMTAAAMTYLPAKRGPLRPIQDDVADANMISWTTSKPVAWTIAAHDRATAAQLANHQRYCRSAAFGMGAMTSVGFHRTTRKIINYLPPAKQTNESALGASIYGSGKPGDANQTFRYNAGVLISAGTFTRVGTGTMSSDSNANTVSITYVDSSTTLRGTHPVFIGQKYRVMFTVSGTAGAQYSAGNAAGGTQYKALTTATDGINSFDFTAGSTTTLHISFTRPTAGTNTFSILTIAQVEVANLDAAHFPQMSWWPAYEHGEQHLIDLAYHEVTLPGLFEATDYGFYGNSTINGVTVPFGGISYKGQIRAASHNARALGNALAIGNPADPHWVMARDYVNHWAEMIERVAQEEDLWRVGSGEPSGLTRTDGRRFQDLKVLVPNNEPTYKVWMHTLGLGAMAHSYGMTEFPRLKELAERFAYLPTVMAGGYTNDNDYLMKPDPVEAVGYEVICMDGLTANGEFRRYWRPGQWSGALTDCTYKADGQTIQFNSPAFGSSTMLDGMVMTASYLRGVGEPHWANTSSPQPAGLTLGIPYYSVQSSGLTCKLSLTLGGPPVTFTPAGGVDQVGHIFRRPVNGVHPMKAGTETSVDANSYLVQVAASLDMVAHYCSPSDTRLALGRSNLRRLLNTRSSPNAYDERGKTTVAAPNIPIIISPRTVTATVTAKKPTAAGSATMTPVEVLTGSTFGQVLGGNAWDWRSDQKMPLARRGTQLDNYTAMGVSIVRFDLDWPAVQPTNSTTYSWDYFDGVINDIVARGLKPLPIFHRTPSWASNGSGIPANMSQFATFCAAAVNRYKDRVRYWEVWNEPNLAGFWPPQPDPVAYTNMLKAVYPAVKAADPTAFVISGGLSSVPTTGLPDHWSEHDFLTQIYANGGGGNFDAVGIHPYSWPLMPSNNQSYNGWTMMSATTPSVRSIMTANGDSAKKIWITEFGAPTGTGTNAVTDATLAAMVTEAHSLAASYPWCGPIVWYEYWDHGESLTDTEANFGLVRNNYLPKPAYNTYLRLKNPTTTAAAATLRQGVNGYAGAVDTRLNQAAPTTAYGAATSITTGGASGSTNKSQALLRFDGLIGTGANQIPANAIIVSAEVQLNVNTEGHGPSFHRMLQSWADTDTWNSRTAGISRDGVEATSNAIEGDYWIYPGVSRFSVTDDVKAWVAGATNYGWLLEPSREGMMAFDSSDHATVANRPRLLVTYIVPDATPVAIPVSGFTATAGDGVSSLDTGAGSITIAYGTAATSRRGSIGGLTPGLRYRVSWTVSNSNATQGQAGFGTSLGGPQYRPTMGGVTGVNTFEFTAEIDTLYLTFQRASTGSSTFSALSIVNIPQAPWNPIVPTVITPAFWTALSSAVNVNGTTGDITIPAAGTQLSAAGSFASVIGKTYRLSFTVATNSVQCAIGTSQGGVTLKSAGVNHATGVNRYEFTATSATTWIQFQRTTTGTTVVSGAILEEA